MSVPEFEKELLKIVREVNGSGANLSDLDEFAELSTSVLRGSCIHEYFRIEDLGKILDLDSRKRARPSFPNFTFSKIPITVYRQKEFFIDLYVWDDRISSIHSHSFSGAFKSLSGESLQFIFEFTPERSIGDGIDLGKLAFLKKFEVTPGNVQMILPEEKFIHSSLHKRGRHTVNLCVRTEFIENPLKSYFFPGVCLRVDHVSINEHLALREFAKLKDKKEILELVKNENLENVLAKIITGVGNLGGVLGQNSVDRLRKKTIKLLSGELEFVNHLAKVDNQHYKVINRIYHAIAGEYRRK